MQTKLSLLKRLVVFLVLLSVGTNYAQNSKGEMYGVVKDQYGEPLLGVSILLKSKDFKKIKKGVTTDLEGKYRIASKDGKGVVVFSFVGMKTKTVPFKKGKFDVVLEESAESLDEVVISTGYQNVKEKEMVGAFNSIDMKGFDKRISGGSENLVTTLEGLSPTLLAASNPSQGGSKQMLIRGVSTLKGSSSPLIIVDGFPYDRSLESINFYDIEDIFFLKDAASASIYGAKAANGVIVVTTKRGKYKGLSFTYNSNVEVKNKYDLGYFANRLSSSDMVDIEQTVYNKRYKGKLESWENYVKRTGGTGGSFPNVLNKVMELMLAKDENKISQAQLDSELARLKGINNLKDFEEVFLITPIYTSNNLALNYVKDNVKLRSSLNHYKNQSGEKGRENYGVKYSLSSLIKISNKFSLDLSANLSMSDSEQYKDGVRGLIKRTSPYERLIDDKGNALAINKPSNRNISQGNSGGKDKYEIQRLIGLGLFDETYKPAEDFMLSKITNKTWNSTFNIKSNVNLLDGLDGIIAFNISKNSSKRRVLYDKNSWQMKNLFNNLTKIDSITGGKDKILIPVGDRISESRNDFISYMLRGQLEFNKTIGDVHKLIGMVGSEISARKSTGTTIERLGYDSRSNLYVSTIDYATLSKRITNVFAPGENEINGLSLSDYFTESENRYFALYGNATYMLKDKYILHGSVRIDQSNLFGTDPRYRYTPFWSIGGKWSLGKEEFFENDIVSRLDLGVSYGINGNISNDQGPFDLASISTGGRGLIQTVGSKMTITTPKVNDLRWEKTKNLNFSLKTGLFNERLGIEFDLYRKTTEDVYTNTRIDPSLGFASIIMNDATIVNNGIEIAINSTNILTDNFSWRTYLGFNHNKGYVKKVFVSPDAWGGSIAGRPFNKEGYAPNSYFTLKYAGVDEEGNAMVIHDGKPVAIKGYGVTQRTFTEDDLEHKGTTIAPFATRVTNNFRYKNVELSLMFIHQGGHILLKDSYNGGYVIGAIPGMVNKDVSKAWKEPGDEKKEGVLPEVGGSGPYTPYILPGTDKNVIPADYIRLRDVVLSYSFPQSFLDRNGFIKDLTVNIKGKNLWMWTKNKEGIDPESHFNGYRNFKTPKSISLGLNLMF